MGKVVRYKKKYTSQDSALEGCFLSVSLLTNGSSYIHAELTSLHNKLMHAH